MMISKQKDKDSGTMADISPMLSRTDLSDAAPCFAISSWRMATRLWAMDISCMATKVHGTRFKVHGKKFIARDHPCVRIHFSPAFPGCRSLSACLESCTLHLEPCTVSLSL